MTTTLPRLLISLMLATGAYGAAITIESTGQNVSGGLDNSFQIISDTTGEILAPAQAFVVTNQPSPWAPAIAGTQWIGPAADQSAGCNCPDSSDVYQTSFSLAGLDPTTAILSFNMLVDNDITVVLNGNTVYTNGEFLSGLYAAPFSFTVNTGFVAGTNMLDLTVGNGFGPTGVDASISGTATPIGSSVPEPSTAALAVAGLGALSLWRRRSQYPQ